MSSWSILVVDDEPAIRRTLERALARVGHTVYTAASGEDACELLQAGIAVDLAFMDLRMPGMSGRTLFQVILAQWPDLARRLAVMSGDPDADDHASWLALHDLPILAKPCTLADVYAMVELLGRREQRKADGHGS